MLQHEGIACAAMSVMNARARRVGDCIAIAPVAVAIQLRRSPHFLAWPMRITDGQERPAPSTDLRKV